jgi:superfamily II DNA or RNA helicase
MTSPTHPKAPPYLRSGIFDSVKSFRGLEARIGALATVQERGDAFEVFAEAYLATVAVEKAKQVWPGASVPPSLRKRLALTIGDKGVDGVFETQLGGHHAYQVKFRTGRPSLTWDELSNFIGQADRVDRRALITNCDRFADVVKERTAFYAITGNDLDKLEPQDFAAIHTWLAGKKIRPQRKTPLPHQAEALDNILAALREQDRATALMACGTGKTLVALWAAEKVAQAILPASQSSQAGLPAPRILVLVPSLALLGQMLHEWSRETSWPELAHLCVCSDPAVKSDGDEIILRSSDLDFPVTTDSAQVRAFLAAEFDGVKLIFSTYQSAHVVAAGMKRGEAFDLAIFDEAHKTAGREGVHFGFALSDRNLAIRKRLFLTATPRHYDLRKRDREGDARLVYSMDAPEIYGPVAHQLTFAEAARRGIICHYRVIISVVTSDMVNDHLLRHGEVLVQGDAVQARHVASQLALQAAVAEHGTGKIFTFHRSVASAAAFTGDGAAGIGNHLPGFAAFHVNGTMPMSERNGIMREFRAAPRAVISNARCLTEGVDVPAVDMVAFLTPKRSRVDIVQATGRAMRKAAGKTTGYVLVPLFVEQAKGETIGQALARTEFDEVWNVLQAMQEQDETLAEIIRQMREERGRTKGFDDTRFRERVEFLGPQLSLETLRNSITTACVEVLGDNWEERLGELKAFKETHGHINVHANSRENPRLGAWATNQRSRRNTLTADQLAKLEEIGFDWNLHETAWGEMFAALQDFSRTHGHCNVPSSYPENQTLAFWVTSQRYHRDSLSSDRLKRLTTIGFIWDAQDEAWKQRFDELTEFRRIHGHCSVPQRYADNPELARWVSQQRLKRDELPQDRIHQLEEIGFDIKPQRKPLEGGQKSWEEMFAALSEFKALHGHCRVTRNSAENTRLAHWVGVQRKKRETLGERRIHDLEKIGFVWNPMDEQWERQFTALKLYKAKHGHCNVPVTRERELDRELGRWCSHQRVLKRSNKLSAERIRRLEVLGFIFDPIASSWEEMFAALMAYKRHYGHCNVSQTDAHNAKLAMWVRSQRARRGVLTPNQIARLEEIGIVWNPIDAYWDEKFSELERYKTTHGDCNVPQKWQDNPSLGIWCNNQRRRRKQLSGDHLSRLDKIGFQWDAKQRKSNT